MTDAIHACCVAIDGAAVLIAGPSGAGKSDLALRLIDRGAVLVSDDRTIVEPYHGRLIARAPDRIAGRMEVRGVGIVTMPFVANLPVVLIVEADDAPARLPYPATRTLHGIAVPLARLALCQASTPCKIDLLLKRTLA